MADIFIRHCLIQRGNTVVELFVPENMSRAVRRNGPINTIYGPVVRHISLKVHVVSIFL